MTELDVQNMIWSKYTDKGSLIIVPGSFVFGWEADMIVVTKALISHEFEIKLTRKDFLSDSKKFKWPHFSAWCEGKNVCIHEGLEYTVTQPPNYFWYVCPKDVIQINEIPKYAGLAYIDNWYLNVQRKPTKIHNASLPIKGLRQLTGSVNARYWGLRMMLYNEQRRIDESLS